MKRILLAFALILSLSTAGYCRDGWYDILQAPADVEKTPPTDGQVLAWDAAKMLWVPTTFTGGSGAPTDAHYYTDRAESGLSAEVVVTGLSTLNGLAKGNGSGGFSAASAGTDYVVPAGSITGAAAKLSISGKTGLLSFTGLDTTDRIKTIRDAADTILELGGSYTPTGTWNWGSATWTNVPTLNQNTSGTASNLSGTPALPNGTTATTQSASDNSTKLATTAYVDTGLGTKLTTPTNNSNIAGVKHKWTISIKNGNSAITTPYIIPIGFASANLTVTKVVANTSSASYEIAGDLKYADARIGLANATVVNDFDTTSGVRSDTTITSASIASGKFVYILFDAAPNASDTDDVIEVEWDYD